MPRAVRPERIPDELDLAWQLLDNDELAEAHELVTAVLLAGPSGEDAVDAYHLRGEILLARGRPREAIVALETAASGLKGDPHILAAIGDAHFALWSFERAQASYERALRADTRHARAHRGMALALDRAGRRELADMHFARAAKLDAESYPAPVRLERAEFDRLAREAIESLPAAVKEHLGPIGFLVEDYPSLDMLADRPEDADPETLGLFFGDELPARFEDRGVRFVPNHIHLFQRNLEQFVSTREELEDEIRTTVYHEVGHYLGYDEDGLEALGLA